MSIRADTPVFYHYLTIFYYKVRTVKMVMFGLAAWHRAYFIYNPKDQSLRAVKMAS